MNHGSLVTGNTLLVNFKKLSPKAVTPTYAKPGDAALDITLIGIKSYTDTYTEYSTGLSFEIPSGYVGLLLPRSSQTNKTQMLGQALGCLDSGFRGEVTVRMRDVSNGLDQRVYEIGEKAVQLLIIPYPKVVLHEVQYLSTTERGEGGYGHTGK